MRIINAIIRLSLSELTRTNVRNICTNNACLIQASPVLYAEPLKKKKKLDPQIIRQREERRRKKLEKQIRRMEKNARQLKPIDELERPVDLINQKEQRMRTVNTDAVEAERRIALNKKWTLYKYKEKLADYQIMDRLMESQNRALEELRKESESLYQEAIKPDVTLLPITIKGPVSTPPIDNYPSPDGEYIHKARNWD